MKEKKGNGKKETEKRKRKKEREKMLGKKGKNERGKK